LTSRTFLIGMTDAAEYFIDANGVNANLHLQTQGSTAIFVEDTGKIGIGTTTPTYQLDVNGTFRAVGITTLDSTLFAPNIGTGVDNSVVILDSDGGIKTDEIDSRV